MVNDPFVGRAFNFDGGGGTDDRIELVISAPLALSVTTQKITYGTGANASTLDNVDVVKVSGTGSHSLTNNRGAAVDLGAQAGFETIAGTEFTGFASIDTARLNLAGIANQTATYDSNGML